MVYLYSRCDGLKCPDPDTDILRWQRLGLWRKEQEGMEK